MEAISFFIGMGSGILCFMLASTGGNEMRKEILDVKFNSKMDLVDIQSRLRFIEAVLKIKEYSTDWKVEDDR
jgi:hypothetical protein